MADISKTPANVLAGINATIQRAIAGATIAAGDTLYHDPADNRLKLCDANGSAIISKFKGIALNGAAAGQPVNYVAEDAELAIGATVAAGVVLVCSSTPGGICPVADIATGMYVTVLGVMGANNKLVLKPSASGVIAA
ncbi:MAG: hypothetical protein V4710_04760 [Verrucomicrobiota bacterium]